jgi:DNA-binding transcriptional regulator GbsR (MarR family)
LATYTKEELIEELGIHFENLYHLPPLATRIHAALILNGDKGFTFDEIIGFTDASKSSVSTSLNLLLKTDKIEYFTKSGDRKRYFRKKRDYLKARLNNYKALIDKEISIFEKTLVFLQESEPEAYKNHLCFTTVYTNYLKDSKQLLESTLLQLENVT